MKAKLAALTQEVEGDVARLELLQKDLSELRQGVTVSSMSPEFQYKLRDILETVGTLSETAKHELILRALAFSDMYGRFEDVEPAHFETFEWIFDEDYGDNVNDDADAVNTFNDGTEFPEANTENDNSGPENDNLGAEDDDFEDEDDNSETEDDDSASVGENNTPLIPSDLSEDTESEVDDEARFGDIEHDYSVREPFLHWLSAGNGVFHIAGKLGSGKSTLMKFLCDHERTTAELQKWAGTQSLFY